MHLPSTAHLYFWSGRGLRARTWHSEAKASISSRTAVVSGSIWRGQREVSGICQHGRAIGIRYPSFMPWYRGPDGRVQRRVANDNTKLRSRENCASRFS